MWPFDAAGWLDYLSLGLLIVAISFLLIALFRRTRETVKIVKIKKEDVELTDYVQHFLKAHSGKAQMIVEPSVPRIHPVRPAAPHHTQHHTQPIHPSHPKAKPAKKDEQKKPEHSKAAGHKRLHMPHIPKHNTKKAPPEVKKAVVQPKPKPQKEAPATKKIQPAAYPEPNAPVAVHKAEPQKAKPPPAKVQPKPHEPDVKDTDRVNRLLSMMAAKAPASNPRRKIVHSINQAKEEGSDDSPKGAQALIVSMQHDLDLLGMATEKLQKKKVDVSQLQKEALIIRRTLNLSKNLPEKSLAETRKRLDKLMWKLSKDYL